MLQLVLPTLLPTLITEFQMSHYTAGILVACFGLPYSLLQIPFGYLSDRKGRKKTMVFGLFLYSSATFLSGLSQNTLQLGLTQFLAGIGGASYHPIGIPLVSVAVSRNKRGQAMGFHQTGGAIGSFIAPLISAYIGTLYSWRYSFVLLSLFGFLIGLFVWLRVKEPSFNDHEEKKIENSNRMLFNSKAMKLMLLLFFFGFIHVISFRGLTPFLTTYATEKYSVSLESAAQLLSLLQIMGIIGSPLLGRLSDVTGRKTMLAILIISQSMVMYLVTYATMGALVVLLGAMGLIVFGCLAVTDTWVTETNVASIMGTVVGVYVSASFFSGAVVTPIVGFLADQIGFDFAFRILSVPTLLGLPILRIIRYEDTSIARPP